LGGPHITDGLGWMEANMDSYYAHKWDVRRNYNILFGSFPGNLGGGSRTTGTLLRTMAGKDTLLGRLDGGLTNSAGVGDILVDIRGRNLNFLLHLLSFFRPLFLLIRLITLAYFLLSILYAPLHYCF
jgi:hypothetical protein